jgi:hypothetical protein
MNTALSYNRQSDDNSFLDPKAYEGRVTVPKEQLEEAKAAGKSYAVTLVGVDAAKNKEGGAFTRGFYALVDLKTGKQTLVPFVSGGYKMGVNAPDFANSKKIESTKDGPLPFAVTDGTGDKDAIHYRGKITAVDLSPTLDDKGRDFRSWIQLGENGSAGSESLGGNRSLIGGHVNLTESMTPEQREKLGKSHGCPVVPPAYEKVMEDFFKKHNIQAGADYTILDPDKVIAPTKKTQAMDMADAVKNAAPHAIAPFVTETASSPSAPAPKTVLTSSPPPAPSEPSSSNPEPSEAKGGDFLGGIMKFIQPFIEMIKGLFSNILKMFTGNAAAAENNPAVSAPAASAPSAPIAQPALYAGNISPSATPALATTTTAKSK